MSSFGIFESAVSSEAEVGLVKQAAADKLASAVYDVREKLGASLFASRSLDEFRDRVEMMKNDQSIYKVISASIHPNTGTVRRIVGRNSVLENEFLTRLAVDGMGASGAPEATMPSPGMPPAPSVPDAGPGTTTAVPAATMPPPATMMARLHQAEDRPTQDLDVTYRPSDGLLDPKGEFKGYQNRVDQGGPQKVQRDFAPGNGGDNFTGSPESDFAPQKMALRVYADWCEANGTDPGRMASLDAYSSNLSDAQYFTIAAAMQADPSFSTMPSINQSAGSSSFGGTTHMPAVQPTKALTGGPHQNWPDQTMVKNWNKAGGLRRQADDSDPTRPGISDELGGAANFLNGLPQPHPTQAPAKGYSPDLEGVGKAIWHGVVGGDTAPDSPAPATGTLPLPGANGPNRVNNPAAPTGGTPAATNAGAVSQAPGGTGVGSPPATPGKTPGVGQPSSPDNTVNGSPAPGVPSAASDYTVKPGDTLNDIAQSHGGGAASDIAKANSGAMASGTDLSKNMDMIHPGDVLHNVGAPPTPAPPAPGAPATSGIGAGGTPMKAPPLASPPPLPSPAKTPGVGQPSSPGNTLNGAPAPGTPGALKGGSRNDPLPHYIAWCKANNLKRISARNVEYYARGNVPLTMHLANRMKTAIRTARLRQGGGWYDQGEKDGLQKEWEADRGHSVTNAENGDVLHYNNPNTRHLQDRLRGGESIEGREARNRQAGPSGYGDDMDDYMGMETGNEGHDSHRMDEYTDHGGGPGGSPRSKHPDDGIKVHGPGGPGWSEWGVGKEYRDRQARRRHAAPDYLQKADEALTQLLNQKAQEFQETIAPLQQALQTVQQAEQLAQQASPLSVMPPAGTINVMPGQDPGGAPMSPQDAMGVAQGQGGPPPGGGDPSAPPPAAGDQGALPPDMQMQGSRRRGGRGKDSGLRAAANVSDLWDKFQGADGNHLGGDYDYEQFANQFGVGTKALEKLKNQHQQGFTASRLGFTERQAYLAWCRRNNLRAASAKNLYWYAGQSPAPVQRALLGNDKRQEKTQEKTWANGGYSGTVDDQLRDMSDSERDQVYQEHPWLAPPRHGKVQKTAWSGWGPAQFPKARQVDGWDWDNHLNGYVSNRPHRFACDCGDEHDTPKGFHRCKCGKSWNSYVIGTGGNNHEAAAEKFLVREIPTRDGVIVANRELVSSRKQAEWSHDPSTNSYHHPDGSQISPSTESGHEHQHQLWWPTTVMKGRPGKAKIKQPTTDVQALMDYTERTGKVVSLLDPRTGKLHALIDPGELGEGEEDGRATMKPNAKDWANRGDGARWTGSPIGR